MFFFALLIIFQYHIQTTMTILHHQSILLMTLLLILNSNWFLTHTEAFSVSSRRHRSLHHVSALAPSDSALLAQNQKLSEAMNVLNTAAELQNKEQLQTDESIKSAFEKTGPSDVTPPPINNKPPVTVAGTNTTTTTNIPSEKDVYYVYKIQPEHQLKLDALKRAQEEFSNLGQEDADRIFNAISQEINMQRLPLAKLAVQETGMGQLEDKVLKNGLAAELIHDRYKNAKTCGLIHDDTYHGLKTYAHPVGPVCALTPVTNPTSTVIAKALMMAKTRNAGIFLPHPKASDSSAEAVRICREAGERAGAPVGWLQVVSHPTMEDSNAIMRSDEVSAYGIN